MDETEVAKKGADPEQTQSGVRRIGSGTRLRQQTWLCFRTNFRMFYEEGVGVMVKRKGYVRKLLP